MIKAVIFDMDGLLIDSEPLWRKAQIAAFKTVGFEPAIDDFNHMMGRGIESVVEHYYHRSPWKGASPADIAALVVDDLIAMIKSEGQLKPGVHHALELCKSENLPLAIATSSSPRIINTVVDTLNIRQFFEHIYSADHEPFSKPHPGVFISAAALLKVRPQHCLVFEDAPAGVLAAKAASMKCIAVPEPDVKNHPFIQTADAVIDSLEKFDAKLLASL